MERKIDDSAELLEEEKKENEHTETTSFGPNKTNDNENRPLSSNNTENRGLQPSSSRRTVSWKLLYWIGFMLRFVFLDVSIALVFALSLMTIYLGRFTDEYLIPAGKLMTWNSQRAARELTYFHRYCDEEDQSTHYAADLLVDSDMTAEDATQVMLTHGAAMFPNILSEETATELRDFILEQNKKNEDMIYVIENTNRWSFYLTVDQHPSVSKALHELLNTNPLLIQSLEKIAGHNPAVIELTTITSAYGAVDQHWHQDVVPENNGAKYSRNFVPSYSLFIPLQNTTTAMGATGLCPGTTMCADGCGTFCAETGFRLSEATAEGNWPVGWGALVNQQTTHMGAGHTDPQGPHRVVMVITFAPRPRFGPHELETRMIGMGGSYSLHWSQWGHTLRDFSNPQRYMKQPWRTLRSLGLHKPSGTDWGWDFVSQTLQRVMNGDVGYYLDDLVEFVDNGGFPFLPQYLQGQLPPGEIKSARTGWIQIFRNTLEKWLEFVSRAYAHCLRFLLLAILVIVMFADKPFVQSVTMVARIGMVHLLIFLLSLWAWNNLESGSWALNVRRSAAFRVPSGPHPMYPHIPASIPSNDDVLILNEMKSSYMASFTDVLEVMHPGNKYFKDLIDASSKGYQSLPRNLQERLRTSIVDLLHDDQRRILTKNEEGNWAEVDRNHAIWYCHKQFSSRSNALIELSMNYLDHALMETRFGYFRDTVMHRKHSPMFLMKLQSDLLRLSPHSRAHPKEGQPSNTFLARSGLPKLPTLNNEIFRRKESSPLMSVRKAEEPFPGAWSAEGDEVEALYASDSREWYKGTIIRASSDRLTWTVRFDDGDVVDNVCAQCVRPFVPYSVGEKVEVRISDSEFATGQVVAAMDGTYDVTLEDGSVVFGTSCAEMRRVDEVSEEDDDDDDDVIIEPGDRVMAMFPGLPNQWFPGVIEGHNKDGSFAIQYDDGDYAPRVDPRHIRLL
ncbi:hypothetical protein FisN_14Lh235 [Fistulifera solaris]|uniref:DUF6824 domain-containing protein n=1 Tax=Fistulifera solaris TaxID=1519565 RepID=A0A1Z5J9S2_FISSO|nr:hypothetical protein FisN_14Lh235 [Fistulifera solaris]|eukprot:GAX10719.1 hypothetical protein FisN_14Lh235 [Fistulifera solaris]